LIAALEHPAGDFAHADRLVGLVEHHLDRLQQAVLIAGTGRAVTVTVQIVDATIDVLQPPLQFRSLALELLKLVTMDI
jgi:hypothetical protein